MDEIWNEAQETETAPEAEPFYNRHYITVDTRGRITDGWSDGPCPDRDAAGAVCIDEQGEYQFRLAPDGEENPPLYAMDGAALTAWDGKGSWLDAAELERIASRPAASAGQEAGPAVRRVARRQLWPGAWWSLPLGFHRDILADRRGPDPTSPNAAGGEGGRAAYPTTWTAALRPCTRRRILPGMAWAATAHKLYTPS